MDGRIDVVLSDCSRFTHEPAVGSGRPGAEQRAALSVLKRLLLPPPPQHIGMFNSETCTNFVVDQSSLATLSLSRATGKSVTVSFEH